MSSEMKKITYEEIRSELLTSQPLISNKIALLFDFVVYLNSVLQIDAEAVSKLIDFAVPCHLDFASHPAIIVREDPQVKLSVLGLLGGYFNLPEYRIAIEINDQNQIIEFLVVKMEKENNEVQTS
jgi:uncharacterized protein YpmS